MRALLAVDNCYADAVSGAARSMRTMMEWLAAAGCEAWALATARFDVAPRASFEAHLESLGVPISRRAPADPAGRPTFRYELNGVEVTCLATEAHDPAAPDRAEFEQFVRQFDRMFEQLRPDLVIAYGGHPGPQEALRRARLGGAATLYSVRNHGYDDRRRFRNADHVLTCSAFLSRRYRDAIGLRSTALPSPLAWSEILAPDDARAFVTFVNPALHKGAALFARLADMLGRRRPDIPILVVQSAADASLVNSVPGVDFARYPQIMTAPSTAQPSDYFALTRLLLAPSVFEEPFGRVAAEAMANGVPPLVSPRGGLPEAVQEGGLVLPLPDWLGPDVRRLPSEAETQPWFDAICGLWDDPAAYAAASARARAAGERLYGEAQLRPRYLDYLESLRPGGIVLDPL